MSSSTTVKRKTRNARQAAGAQANARKVRKAKSTTSLWFSRVMEWVPLSENQLHRVFMGLILCVALGVMWAAASAAGLPTMARRQVASIASSAGFEAIHVKLNGVKRLNELKVYERASTQLKQAMTEVDVNALRNELMQLSWVEDARVSRQLPDTLVIDIVERKPHAVLRLIDKLVLIDAKGHHLEPISEARAKGKLILAGPQAGKQVEQLSALLEAAPALRPQVREADWVGSRRWNLTFSSGQMLALPEGEKQSADALISFARLDGTNRLLGGKVAAFDMRSPDRIYLRIPGRSAQEQQAKLVKAQNAETPKAAEAKPVDAPAAETKPVAKPSGKPSAKPAKKPGEQD
jgi:cell division protein FtsQ